MRIYYQKSKNLQYNLLTEIHGRIFERLIGYYDVSHCYCLQLYLHLLYIFHYSHVLHVSVGDTCFFCWCMLIDVKLTKQWKFSTPCGLPNLCLIELRVWVTQKLFCLMMDLQWHFKTCCFSINRNARHKKGSHIVGMIQRHSLCDNT